MINYGDLGSHKRLNEIVMAGSHDAGITKGGANAMTQNLDIAGQANVGVRVFDLRIAAERSGLSGKADMKAIHAAPIAHLPGKALPGALKSAVSSWGNSKQRVQTSPLLPGTGAFGQGLTKMLGDAKQFVTSNQTEFLILKFDKSTNWHGIARACVELLGDKIYRPILGAPYNINEATLGHLAGKVVVLFTSDGFKQVSQDFRPVHGIFQVVSLTGKSQGYERIFAGMQYCGKGGTDIGNIFGDKIKENHDKQRAFMQEGAGGDPNVMGMMYWTSTGISESIKKRNDKMWNPTNVASLNKLWSNGLSDAITQRMPSNVDPTSASSGGQMKVFMPNIVMIDFADADKCQTIYDLNAVAASQLTMAALATSQRARAGNEGGRAGYKPRWQR